MTISGTEMGEATAVKFGSTKATSFETESPTSITAIAPAETAGTVHVTVSNRDGTSAISAADEFTYVTPGPGPTIVKLSPKKGPAVGQTSVTITGTSFVGVTAIEFGSANATSYTVNSSASVTAVSPAGTTGTVEVFVTTPNGTSGTTSKDRFEFGSPTVTSVNPNVGSKEGGTRVTVTGSGFVRGSGTTFKFGKGLAILVECISTTDCRMLSPAAARPGTVDVRAASSKKISKKTRSDHFTYD